MQQIKSKQKSTNQSQPISWSMAIWHIKKKEMWVNLSKIIELPEYHFNYLCSFSFFNNNYQKSTNRRKWLHFANLSNFDSPNQLNAWIDANVWISKKISFKHFHWQNLRWCLSIFSWAGLEFYTCLIVKFVKASLNALHSWFFSIFWGPMRGNFTK